MHGVCIGAGRLVAEVGSSFLHIIGQFAEGIGTGIRTATYIDMPLERTLIMKPQSLTHGIVSGTMMFSADCRAAAKNIVCLPLQGWAEQGVIGALKGTACGVSGLLLPIAGVMDLMAHATFGVGAELENLGASAGRGQGGRRPRRNHVQVCPSANLAKAWPLPTLSVPKLSCAHGHCQRCLCPSAAVHMAHPKPKPVEGLSDTFRMCGVCTAACPCSEMGWGRQTHMCGTHCLGVLMCTSRSVQSYRGMHADIHVR
jgi:hypothetical protein